MKSNFIYLVTSGFISGILLRSFFTFSSFFVLIFIILALAFLFYSLISGEIVKNKSRYVSVFLIFLSFGIFRFNAVENLKNDKVLDQFLNTKIKISGEISSDISERETGNKFIVSADTLTTNDQEFKIKNKVNVLVTSPIYSKFSYGDQVLVSGTLEKPENFITDIGKEFDYVSYLSKDDIFYLISFSDTQTISSGGGNFVKRNLFKFKNLFLEKIKKVISQPESSLAGGILLGVKQSLPKDLNQAFIDTGLVHIIVLSGYNITIIAEAILKFFSYFYFIPLWCARLLGGSSIILFALMSGAEPATIRASIMALLVLFARMIGRTYEINRALCLAGFLMLWQKPEILLNDISFQLSFLATIGLIYLSPIFEKKFYKLPEFLNFKSILASTLAAQIFVLPFLLYKIGNLSLIAPLSNILILPFIPISMFFSFMAGVFGFIFYPISILFGGLSYLFLHYIIVVTQFFAQFSFSSVIIRKFPLILVFILYLILFWIIYRQNKSQD